MKTKDIIIVVVCIIAIGGAVFLGINMLMPAKSKTVTTNTQTTSTEVTKITGEIDQTTLDKLDALKNYGDTDLSNIGRVNPFAPLN
jgi:flagellar basal body-associated protein FliL